MQASDLLIYADQLIDLKIPQTVTEADLLYLLTHTPSGNLRKLGGRSVKTDKGNKRGVLTMPVYMSPHREGGKNMCAGASAGCIASWTLNAARVSLAQCFFSCTRIGFSRSTTTRSKSTPVGLNVPI